MRDGRSPDTAPAPAPDAVARRTARWVGALFLIEVLCQRLRFPSSPVSLVMPLLLVWMVLGLRRGVLEFDLRRLVMWFVALGAAGLALIAETALLSAPLISTESLWLLMVVWLPAVARFADRRMSTYVLSLHRVVSVCTGLAMLCIAMIASQLVGIRYVDPVEEYLPRWIVLHGFNTTYPVEFGAALYRANGWIGLEASIASFLIGLGLLAGFLIKAPVWKLVVLIIGQFCTFAGSGFLVILVGVLALVGFQARSVVLRYAPLAFFAFLVALFTPLLKPLLDRATGEFGDPNSSASLRAAEGYIALWPRWSSDVLGMLIGHGSGSAQRYAGYIKGSDLLVPTLGRIIFDFGLVAGVIIIGVMLFFYLDGPSASIAFTMMVSLWAFQPGGSQVVFALPVIVTVTLWAPRAGPRIEDIIGATLAPPRLRGLRRIPVASGTTT
jgi:hypothetical protein